MAASHNDFSRRNIHLVFSFGSLSQQESTQVHVFQSWLGKFFQQLHPCHVTFLLKIFFQYEKLREKKEDVCMYIKY